MYVSVCISAPLDLAEVTRGKNARVPKTLDRNQKERIKSVWKSGSLAKGAVALSSAKLGNYKKPAKLRET